MKTHGCLRAWKEKNWEVEDRGLRKMHADGICGVGTKHGSIYHERGISYSSVPHVSPS